jgi:molecular chaperone DnaK
MFSTAVDNQTNVEIHVLQGERELVKDNKSLGNFRLDGIPQAERGTPQIKVTFDIDVDGILSVKAKETKTDIEQSITIQGASTLDKKEIEEMIKSAEQFAAADQEQRKIVDLKNNAETLCYEAEKELRLFSDTMKEDKTNKIKSLIENIRKNINSENIEELTSNIEELKIAMKEMVETNSTTQ